MNWKDLQSSIDTAARRATSTAVNVLEYARYGGLETGHEPSPFEVLAETHIGRLRRYFPDVPRGSRDPVLLIPPPVLSAGVWDISPQTSAVALLHEQNLEPWVLDFGDPTQGPDGHAGNVTDYVLAVSDAIEHVAEKTGHDVHVGGYSQGGLFCYQAVAYRRCEGVASVFVLGAPVVLTIETPLAVPKSLAQQAHNLTTRVFGHTGVPGWLLSGMFKWADPVGALRTDLRYLMSLHDRDAVLPREPQRRFLAKDGWVSWTGPAIAELNEIVRNERYTKGGLVFGNRTVSFSDITCPILLFVGENDEFGPPSSVRAIGRIAKRATIYEMLLPVGHFGLGIGRQARKYTWPGVGEWVRWQSGTGPMPELIRPLQLEDDADGEMMPQSSGGFRETLGYGADLIVGAALAAPRVAVVTGKRAISTVSELSREAATQLPRLLRLEQMGPQTRISHAALIAKAAESNPDDVFFLFDDRAHTFADANRRIDAVARGLVSVGVRRGERVGLLMETRPSALTALAALNRIGAIVVLLRPGGSPVREAILGRIRHVITDPEHIEDVSNPELDVLVLGGGSGSRRVPAGSIDLEQIDPDEVVLPDWYKPNPGLARDIAFVLFTGEGPDLRATSVTNGRWARSALCAAAAASLTPADTVYSVCPIHHPSGLLLATAASTAGGARLAMTTHFDPHTFWSEVRRYGATVVPYTWTMLRQLVNAPECPDEHHHPIRLFIGSGMPGDLSRRVTSRFAPAGVLELYASTTSGAILGDVTRRKAGSVGRRLPGTPRVRVARLDADGTAVAIGQDGHVVPARVGEKGMLLVEADPATAADTELLRSAFKVDDAWIAAGDIFCRDDDGDLWYVDSIDALIPTARGPVSPRSVESILNRLPDVDLSVCGASVPDPSEPPLAVASVALQPETRLSSDALTRAFAGTEPTERPDIVQLVDEIAVNAAFRPIPTSDQAVTKQWLLSPKTGRYRSVTATRV